MPEDAAPPEALASCDPTPEGPRLTTSRSLAVIFAVLVAAMVGVRWWTLTHGDREPWCVWATPTGKMLTWATPPVPEFADVRDAPGGRSLEGDWTTSSTYREVDGKRSASVPGLWVQGSQFLTWIGLGRHRATYESTCVEVIGPDGRKATAFVRSSVTTGLGGPCPDASVAGTWELVDSSGARRRLDLDASGIVEGAPGVIWGVRDGALVIDHGPLSPRDSHEVETFVLSEDRQSLDGTALDHVHGTKVD